MTEPLIKGVPSYSVSIHMAGDIQLAKAVIGVFCKDEGLCVTVTPTTYVYTGGSEEGFRVGLINYPRFPKEPGEIRDVAERLAQFLRPCLQQQSYCLESPERTLWVSWRPEDAVAA